MIAAVVILVVIGLAVTVYFAGFLRRVVLDESESEARLKASTAHTISFAVPAGIDAADLRTAVTHAGFTSRLVNAGGRQRLEVLCEERQRDQLRKVLEDAHDATYDGTELDLHPVVFEDEASA